MEQSTVIVFDLGKVLVDFDYSIAARRIVKRCNGGADPENFFGTHRELLQKYELGLVNSAGVFGEICKVNGFVGTSDEFGEYFADIFTPIPRMVQLHESLRANGFATYIFSNTNELAVGHIRSRFPFFSNFTSHILSYQHGAMKPGPKLYEVVERETGKTGKDIIYIDDLPENAAAGAARGWRAVLHETPEKTCQAVEGFLGKW